MNGVRSPEVSKQMDSAPALAAGRGLLWAALFAVGILFAIGQGSGAVLPVHDAQHPGNHHDEVRLTAALNNTETFSELTEAMPWGPILLGWSYVLDEYLGIESTTERRLLSVALATLGLVYLVWALARYEILPPLGALLAGALYAISATISLYGTIGLTPYAALLLFSTVYIHVLARNAGRPLTWAAAGSIGILFAFLTFLFYRSVSCVGAVVASLLICELIRSERGFRNYLHIAGKHALLGVPSLVSGVGYLVLFPPDEMLEPRRGFHLYFMLSGVPKTIAGAMYFAWDRTLDLFRQALAPTGVLVGGEPMASVLEWGLLGLMLVGLLGSLVKPKGKRFALGVAFLIGVAGHLSLSFATIIPYGNMRYFLPFACFFPVFAALGVTDISSLLRRTMALLSRGANTDGRNAVMPDPFQPGSRLANGVVVGILVGLTLFSAHLVYRNRSIEHRVEQGYFAVADAYHEGPIGLVFDDWTAVTVQDTHPEFLERDHYVLAPNKRTQWRGTEADSLAQMTAWDRYLGAHDRLLGITSMPFRKRYYGPVFDRVARTFRIQEMTGIQTLHFSKFERKDPARELLNDPEQLSSGAWQRNAIEVEHVSGQTFQVSYEGGGMLKQELPVTVGKGEELIFSVTLWAEREVRGVRLMLKRNDRGPMDGRVRKIAIGPERRRYVVSHTFERPWQNIAVGIAGPEDKPADVFVRDPKLRMATVPAP